MKHRTTNILSKRGRVITDRVRKNRTQTCEIKKSLYFSRHSNTTRSEVLGAKAHNLKTGCAFELI